LNAHDRLRREVIRSILCAFRVDVPAVERRWGISFWTEFDGAAEALAELAADGLVEVGERSVALTELGRLFARVVAMAFDPHARARLREGRPAFSTVC
jgi:oxygen-independent coproporphyrinogen-3 oxidase